MSTQEIIISDSDKAYSKEVKCVVWDLDNTIWEGILSEGDELKLKPDIENIISELDKRGILHSIASKNNYDDAIAQLEIFGIRKYFLYPEIHWQTKSDSILNIQKNLNIGIDTILFIDDQPYERDEVADRIAEVETIDAAQYQDLINYSRLTPRFITEDSSRRRTMYLEDITRNADELNYKGPKEDFLASLQMKFLITHAKEEDLKRAEELTIRTNQLNATGQTYDYEELRNFIQSNQHWLLVCELSDTYGSYGKIGLALIELQQTHWQLKLLLMSCRVISRSVGSVLLNYIMQAAKKEGKKLLADFKQTDRNKLMYVTYRFANFKEKLNDGMGNILLEHDLSEVPQYPFYIDITTP